MTERRIAYTFMNDAVGGRSWLLPYAGEITDVDGDSIEVTVSQTPEGLVWIGLVVRGPVWVHRLTDEQLRQLTAGYELRDTTNRRFL